MLGILAGVALGLSPLGPLLLHPSSPEGMAVAALVPSDLGIVTGTLKSAVEVMEILGSATLGVQAVVLASSLYQRPTPAEEAAAAIQARAVLAC